MEKIDLFFSSELPLLINSLKMDVVSAVKSLPAKQFEPGVIDKETKKLRKEYLVKVPSLDFKNQKIAQTTTSIFSGPSQKTKAENPGDFGYIHVAISYTGTLEVLSYNPKPGQTPLFINFVDDEDGMRLIKEIRNVGGDSAALLTEQATFLEQQFKELTKLLWKENDLLGDFIVEQIKERAQNIQDNKDFVDGLMN